MCVNLWYQQNGHFVCISLKAKYPYFVSTMHHPPSQFIASEPTFSLSGRHISPCMPTHNPLLSQIFSLSQRGVHFYVFPSSRSDQQPVQPPIDHRLWHCSRCCPVSTTSLLGQSRRLRRPPPAATIATAPLKSSTRPSSSLAAPVPSPHRIVGRPGFLRGVSLLLRTR